MQSAADRLATLKPGGEGSICGNSRFTSKNALDVVKHYDIVVTGRTTSRRGYLVTTRACSWNKAERVREHLRFDGQATVFDPRVGRATAALYPNRRHRASAELRRGRRSGILPVVIGCIQATETIKLILGVGEPFIGRAPCTTTRSTTDFKTFQDRRARQWAVGAPHRPSRD